jgi:hypothetical protein
VVVFNEDDELLLIGGSDGGRRLYPTGRLDVSHPTAPNSPIRPSPYR